jgi:hypothetical protein
MEFSPTCSDFRIILLQPPVREIVVLLSRIASGISEQALIGCDDVGDTGLLISIPKGQAPPAAI